MRDRLGGSRGSGVAEPLAERGVPVDLAPVVGQRVVPELLDLTVQVDATLSSERGVLVVRLPGVGEASGWTLAASFQLTFTITINITFTINISGCSPVANRCATVVPRL